MALKVVNVDGAFENTSGYAWQERCIRGAGGEMVLCKARTEDEIIAACTDAHVIVVENSDTPITPRVLENLPSCAAILKCAVGVDNISVDAASEAGIVVCNIADYCTEEVSDHAVALLLGAARRVPALDAQVRAGAWHGICSAPGLRRIRHLTLGLIGFGRIARAVARKMSGFEMRILATRRNMAALEPELGVELLPLDDLLREADLISVHVALTPQTRNMLSTAQLGVMKPTAIVVNTSRGAIIDEQALALALQQKRIGGAALDVTVEEPLAESSPLRSLENVIVTPHAGGSSVDAIEHWQRTIIESLEAILKGRWPPFPVNGTITPRATLR